MKAFYASIVILISSIYKASINTWDHANRNQKIVLNSLVQFATSSLYTHKDSLLKHRRGWCKGFTSIYKCETSDKEFDRSANLKHHVAIHDKQHYNCNGCLKEYKRLDHLTTIFVTWEDPKETNSPLMNPCAIQLMLTWQVMI